MKHSWKAFSIKILTALVALTVVMTGAINTVNVSADAGSVELPSFRMLESATIRLADENGENAGIRFSSVISKEEYAELSDYSVEAGTFIMPYDYIGLFGDLNAENCFGAGAKYCWNGDEPAKHTILHVAGTFVDNEADGSKMLKASVVNMLDENLDRPYVAQAYIKLVKNGKTQYVFAERGVDDCCSVLQLSQSIWLNQTAKQAEKDLAENYVETFLSYYKAHNNDQLPKLTVKREVFVNCSTGYEKLESFSDTPKEVTFAEIDDFAELKVEIPEIEGYNFNAGMKENTAFAVIDPGRTSIARLYYDTDRKVAIFDGAREGSDIFAANGVKIAGTQAANVAGSSDWGFQGSKSLRVSAWGAADDWVYLNYNQPLILPEATKTISMWVRNGDLVEAGTDNKYNFKILIEGNGYSNEFTYRHSLVSGDVYKIMLELPKKISNIRRIGIHVPNSDGGYSRMPIYIDHICAEFDFLGGTDSHEAHAPGENIELNFKEKVDSLWSTVFSDREMANAKVSSVTCKKLAEKIVVEQKLRLIDNKTRVTVDNETNYEIKYLIKIDDYTAERKFFLLGYFEGLYESFEDATKYDTSYEYYTPQSWELTNITSVDGDRSLLVKANEASWLYFPLKQPKNFGKSYTKFCFWMNYDMLANKGDEVVTRLSQYQWLCMMNGAQTTYTFASTSLAEDINEPGWHYYEVLLTAPITSLQTFCFADRYLHLALMDRIAFK